ncbi:PhoH family protein (plasmid) [Bernardetia sp. Wsw4-3y2]|uniref:PhoH family protein n=1 Tax=unclassified Bernardetia TaxID=2647129 RepID=UPI0030D1E68D
MVEKIIPLKDISLVDFLGVENRNIKEISLSFPNSKIVARGNELRIQGNRPELLHINEIINLLLEHYNRYGSVSVEDVRSYIEQDADMISQARQKDENLVYGIQGTPIRAKTPNQRELVEAASHNDVVFALGPAGTGKTYIAVALAVRALKNKQVKKIIITRPAVEAGESLGFLPGDMKEKIDPYLRPIYDALADMIAPEKLKFYQDTNVIEIAPIAYMRGRTLSNAFVLLDEAQNTTTMQLKMFLTRLGLDSKMIITGDMTQVDLPRNVTSGLAQTVKILRDIDGVAVVELSGKDVVRHKLVRHIISAYESLEDQIAQKSEERREAIIKESRESRAKKQEGRENAFDKLKRQDNSEEE